MKKIVMLNKILVIISLFILIGCNSSDNKNDSEPVKNNLIAEPTPTAELTPKPTPTAELTHDNSAFNLLNKARRVNSVNTQMTYGNRRGTSSTFKTQQKLHKANAQPETYDCAVSGTFTVVTTEDGTTVTQNIDCTYYWEKKMIYENGYTSTRTYEDIETFYFYQYTYISDYENYPGTGEYYEDFGIAYNTEGSYIDGTIDSYEEGTVIEKQHYYKFFYFENMQTHALSLEGRFSDTFKCFAEDYTYKTLEELVPHDSNPDYYKSGTIIINGMKYVYHGDEVTLSENGETGTFSQQEVLDYFEEETSNDSCSKPNQLSKASSQKF